MLYRPPVKHSPLVLLMYLWVTIKQDNEITRWSEASAALIRALRELRPSDDRRNEMEALWSRNDFPLLVSVRQWFGKWQHNAHLSWREASRRTDDVRGLITEASLVWILSYPRLGWHLGFFCFYMQQIQNAKNGLNANDVENGRHEHQRWLIMIKRQLELHPCNCHNDLFT